MEMAVQLVQVQQSERDLILQNTQIRLVLGGESIGVEGIQPLAKVLVVMPLSVEIGRTHVVQQVVEILAFVLVQAHAGRHGRREGQRGVDKLIRKTGELVGWSPAATGSEQNYGEECDKFRHGCNCTAYPAATRER
jgi:hypothetical protein